MHKIEHTCLWGSCLIIVSAVLSHGSTQMQIIVSNLGPHICRGLQRTRPHQEHGGDLHTTVGALPRKRIATHPSVLKCARRKCALVVPNPHNQARAGDADTRARKRVYMLYTCPCPPTLTRSGRDKQSSRKGWKCCCEAFLRHKRTRTFHTIILKLWSVCSKLFYLQCGKDGWWC